jgi:hypothetical protein
MIRETPDQVCDGVAAGQFGAIARRQALLAGMSASTIDRRVASGRWVQAHSGVYLVAGSPDTWWRRAMATNLFAGPGSALSGLTAAAVLGLRESRPLLVHVTTDRQLMTDGVRVHRSLLIPSDTIACGPLIVTRAARTLMDLAAVLDQDRLEDCLEEALHRRLLNIEALVDYLSKLNPRGRRGIGKLRRLVAFRDPSATPNETKFETLLFRTLRNAALPLPERQFRVWEERKPLARLDFAYPADLLGVPADSYVWHARRQNWERDIDQRNRLLALGWRLRPTTWTELKRRPDRFTCDIRQLLTT